MAVSDDIHSLSRLQEEFFFIVAKLHIYSYDDYQFCRFQSKFGKILPELSEDDFLALRACELYGTYDDWVNYHNWTSIQSGIPTTVRDKEVDRSFQEYNPNLLIEDNPIIGCIGNMEDIEALIACLLYGTAEDWKYYLAWVSNPKALHDSIREKEVSMAFQESNPNVFDCDDDDIPERYDFYGSDECEYQKDRMTRSNRIKGKYLKDKKHVCNVDKILDAKCEKAFRDLPSGYTVEVCLCEDEDGLTIGKRAVLLKSFIMIKADNYFSSHHGIIKSREEKAKKQESSWLKRRFGISCEGDSKYPELEPCYILAPIYVDVQEVEHYVNYSHGGSSKRKVSYTAEKKLNITDVNIRYQHKLFYTGIIHGRPGLPGI